jgi:hypothetical protein
MDNGVTQNCYNTGNVNVIIHGTDYIHTSVGGIVGEFFEGNVINCYNKGDITANVDSYLGGVIGCIYPVYGAAVSYCYWYEEAYQEVDGSLRIGPDGVGIGEVMYGTWNDTGTTSFDSEMVVSGGINVKGIDMTDLLDALNAYVDDVGGLEPWLIVGTINNGFPIFGKDVPPIPPLPPDQDPAPMMWAWVAIAFTGLLFLLIFLDDDDEEVVGKVTYDGEGLAGARIEYTDDNVRKSVMTDKDGRYVIHTDNSEITMISVTKDDYAVSEGSGLPVRLLINNGTITVNFTMTRSR